MLPDNPSTVLRQSSGKAKQERQEFREVTFLNFEILTKNLQLKLK